MLAHRWSAWGRRWPLQCSWIPERVFVCRLPKMSMWHSLHLLSGERVCECIRPWKKWIQFASKLVGGMRIGLLLHAGQCEKENDFRFCWSTDSDFVILLRSALVRMVHSMCWCASTICRQPSPLGLQSQSHRPSCIALISLYRSMVVCPSSRWIISSEDRPNSDVHSGEPLDDRNDCLYFCALTFVSIHSRALCFIVPRPALWRARNIKIMTHDWFVSLWFFCFFPLWIVISVSVLRSSTFSLRRKRSSM